MSYTFSNALPVFILTRPIGKALVLSLLTLPLFFSRAQAQNLLPAPDLRCIKNDTLFWEAPVFHPCGPFQQYQLYGSTAPAGPYALITSITDPAQTFFVHPTPGSEVWYYYMQTAQNCPGFLRLSSDTLSTAPPPQVPLTQVTVLQNQVQLSWPASTAPQVDRYIIYRNTPSGTIPVDTVFGSTVYTDPNAQPQQQSEIYYVVAADPCGNNSLFDVLQQTIFLQTSVDACARTISLQWNPYINWPGGVARQEIWVSINGQAAQPVETLAGSAISYTYTNADAISNYCFTVRAFQEGTTAVSRSNEVCLTPDVRQPPRQMQMKYISVNAAQEPELEWIWESYAELESARIERSLANVPFTNRQDVPVNPPLQPVNAFTDLGADARPAPIHYRIFARDVCGQDWITPPAAPVWLQAVSQQDFRNQLSWTALELAGAQLEKYEVYEARQNLLIPLGQTTGEQFEHILEAGRIPEEPVCYLVEATYRLELPNGEERRFSRSNRACARQEVRVWMPNAFAPRGLNNRFQPLLVFADYAGYELAVFNRWGGEVFRTTDPAEGWDGKYLGADAAPGVYVWKLEMRTADGQDIRETGTVTLLR